MAYPEELLNLAAALANSEAQEHSQASLRRAVSTAYYAFFHLLISEATLNWAQVELRPAVGRLFEHGVMRTASERTVSLHKNAPPRTPESELLNVAKKFVECQERRSTADYDLSKDWSRTDVLKHIDEVTEAFGQAPLIC